MAYLELQDLHRAFGSVVALKGIDLTLDKGEFVSLLGPSGCGKTTALRLVAGFDRPTSGQVVVDGKDVSGVPPNRRNMGMVFQAYSLFPNMTADKNVEFGLRVRRVDRARRAQRALELLELVGLAEAADRYPHQPPRLCARDRRRDAPAPAGLRDRRSSQPDCRRRGRNGGDGPAALGTE